ncbi:6-phosphogluconolactonase [Microbacterium sp.]|uniref:6-phosphogluconolactonase n=1 Tax=Microbacterium sp. TaxID=51671 RepID=UPI003A8492A2
MTPSPVRRFADAASLGRELAADIADRIERAASDGEGFVLGCPGGRTPMSTYAALADEFAARGLDLTGLVIAMMDDYVQPAGDGWGHIPADAHNSCRRFAREEIQAVLNAGVAEGLRIPDENVWFPDPAEPAAYDERLRAAGGVDFFILASGAGDGHVAFNPPGSDLDSRTRVVELAEQTRRDNLATFPDYRGLDDVPGHGVTVGIRTIAEQSRAAAMILIGGDKQDAFARLRQGEGYDPDWPATVYRLVPGALLYADAAAVGDDS